MFLTMALQQAHRMLSQADGNPCSRTFGCFDRNYWHYQSSVDFPSAIYQQAALSLALLYQYDAKDNMFYGNKKILDLCKGAMRFWCSIQNRDGSFNEWYPHEHSFVATAFTCYAVSEALLILNLGDRDGALLNALERSGEWLSRNSDIVVSNHTAAAVAALYNIYLVTKKDKFKAVAQRQLDVLRSLQDPEGWFPEYGGMDPGYLSVTIDFLAKYYKKSGEPKALSMLNNGLHFMDYCMHPDGSYGGEYGSRNTKFIFPHGLVLCCERDALAKRMISMVLRGFSLRTLVSVANCDGRYLTFFFLPNYLQAGLESSFISEDAAPEAELQQQYEKEFPNAGLFIKKTPRYFFIGSYKKNGAFKIFDSAGSLVSNQSGYFLRFDNRAVASSNYYNASPQLSMRRSGAEIELTVTVRFKKDRQSHPLKFSIVPFRLFIAIAGRCPVIACWFGRLVKKIMIQRLRLVDISLQRQIRLSGESVSLTDAIINNTSQTISGIQVQGSNISGFTPSSRYTIDTDFIAEEKDFGKHAQELNTSKRTEIKQDLKFNL